MNAPTPSAAEHEVPLRRSIGLHGRTMVLTAMAGGTALGGVLVAAMTLGGQLSGHALFLNATGLFLVGALVGLVHGIPLGYFGRPAEEPAHRARGDMALGLLYLVPGLAVAWLAAVWMAMSMVAVYTGSAAALAGVAVGWLAGAGILGTWAVHAVRALRNGYARWPERRAGTLLVGASFAALLMILLADRPEIWGLRLRVTETGAVLVAALLAVWVAGPMVTLALRLLRSLPGAGVSVGLVQGHVSPVDVGVGVLAGVVVGLLAVPFAGPAVQPATVGTVVVETSQALVTEVVLRLFLLTGTAWLLLRWHRIHAAEAAAGAIGIAAIAQMLLYAPGALRVGFASAAGTAAFLLTVALVPAVVFGVLFWRRGFAAAFAGHAAALIALALLA